MIKYTSIKAGETILHEFIHLPVCSHRAATNAPGNANRYSSPCWQYSDDSTSSPGCQTSCCPRLPHRAYMNDLDSQPRISSNQSVHETKYHSPSKTEGLHWPSCRDQEWESGILSRVGGGKLKRSRLLVGSTSCWRRPVKYLVPENIKIVNTHDDLWTTKHKLNAYNCFQINWLVLRLRHLKHDAPIRSFLIFVVGGRATVCHLHCFQFMRCKRHIALCEMWKNGSSIKWAIVFRKIQPTFEIMWGNTAYTKTYDMSWSVQNKQRFLDWSGKILHGKDK